MHRGKPATAAHMDEETDMEVVLPCGRHEPGRWIPESGEQALGKKSLVEGEL